MSNYRRGKLGFTMAEVLIVVAILAILAGVVFVSVVQHQKSLTAMEYDTIAKEIFVAAQNHLTMAKGLGYTALTESDFGEPASGTAKDTEQNPEKKRDIYYVVSGSSAKILDLMLPFGAIDETVRAGGSYVIRYQPSSATVLDVFYSDKNDSKYGCTLGSEGYSYVNLMNNYQGDVNAGNRREGPIIGWFGDERPVETGERLSAPGIEVINREKLIVRVTSPGEINQKYAALKLYVKGETSGAQGILKLAEYSSGSVTPHTDSYENTQTITDSEGNFAYQQYIIVLDDITTARRQFASLTWDEKNGTLIPGENLEIYAEAFNNDMLSNIAQSPVVKTNSLFSDETTEEAGKITAEIENFRHLENLGTNISNVNPSGVTATVSAAEQLLNLRWTEFFHNIDELNTKYGLTSSSSHYVYPYGLGNSPSAAETLLPINMNSIEYNGKSNRIYDLSVDLTVDTYNQNAGLFGELKDSTVKNLALIDPSIKGSGSFSAGALTGTASDCTISNVVAYHTAEKENTASVAGNGSAGGLIGTFTVTGGTVDHTVDFTVDHCAASLLVSDSSSAGGLIGTVNGNAKVSYSYSGGHTHHSENGSIIYSNTSYNVTAAAGVAGGLIGTAGSATVSNCYSTCSVSGSTAGGFVGTAGGSLTNCYCTGLIDSTKTTIGAFAGSYNGTAAGCSYYSIINEVIESKDDSEQPVFTGEYLKAISGLEEEYAGIFPFDETTDRFNEIARYTVKAEPYDSKLKNWYSEGKYLFKGIKDFENSTTKFFVDTHYGDWPAAEVFFINTGNS